MFHWFIQLRWAAFFGQFLLVGISNQFLGIPISWPIVGMLLLTIPLTNICATKILLKKYNEKIILGSLIFIDTIILTLLLQQTGGPMNPFSIVYFLHVVLSAIVLTSAWTWAIAMISSLSFGLLFLYSNEASTHHIEHHDLSSHLYGMLGAHIAVVFLSAYFLNRIIGELRLRERQFQRMETREANHRRLMSLTTRAAGAAHELGTPLGTITVIAHELESALKNNFPHPALIEDVHLLKNEAMRCKQILNNLSEQSGDLLGEMPQRVSVEELLSGFLEKYPEVNRIVSEPCQRLILTKNAVILAVRSLIKNAVEACRGDSSLVTVAVETNADTASFIVADRGKGIPKNILNHIGEPFFSTKETDAGMGLGVYLARLTAEQLGGSLQFDSQEGQGTTFKFTVPNAG